MLGRGMGSTPHRCPNLGSIKCRIPALSAATSLFLQLVQVGVAPWWPSAAVTGGGQWAWLQENYLLTGYCGSHVLCVGYHNPDLECVFPLSND